MREHDTLTLLRRLVAFPTVSSQSNLPMIDFIANYLADCGIDTQVLRHPTQPKANLLATIGPPGPAGVVLSGHTDVVPVDGQEWSSAPFELRMAQGRAYGRGSADMKGFIAAVLSRIPTLPRGALRRPLHLAFSYDEEIGCLGAPALIDAMRAQIPPPRAVIVGEPTEMKLVIAHKGVTILRTRVRGCEAHSSMPHLGVNAIAIASRLINELSQIETALLTTDAGDPRFCPRGTTVSATLITGGSAANIVPRDCSFTWDIRDVADAPAAIVIERFRSHCEALMRDHAGTALSIATEIVAHVPALAAANRSAAHLLATALLEDTATDVISIGSEAGMFQAAGYPAILCGPGSIAQAHKPDEFVELDQLSRCEALVDRLLRSLATDIQP